MKQFAPLLERINQKLDLPQPAKSRILLEIAADLEDLYEYYRSQGLDENEARQRSEEKFDMTDDAVKELISIHQSLFKRLFDKLSQQAQSRWERILLFVSLLIITAMTANTIFMTKFFNYASHFVWLPVALTISGLAIALTKYYSIFIKKEHQIKTIRKGLPLLFFIGSSSLVFSIFGYCYEIYRAGEYSIFMHWFLMIIISPSAKNTGFDLFKLYEFMVRSSSLMLFGIFSFMLISIIWYGLTIKSIQIEKNELNQWLNQ